MSPLDNRPLGSVFNTSVSNGANFFSTNLKPIGPTGKLQLAVTMSAANALDLLVMDADGANTQTIPLRAGASERSHVVTYPIRSDRRYNVRHGGAGAVLVQDCVADEMIGGAAAIGDVGADTVVATLSAGLLARQTTLSSARLELISQGAQLSNAIVRLNLLATEAAAQSAVSLLSSHGTGALATETALQSAISILSNAKTRLDLLGTETAAQSSISILSNIKTRADLLGTEIALQSAISLLSSHGTGALGTESALQSAISILSNSKTRLDLLGSEVAFQSAISLLSAHGTGALGTEAAAQSAISILSNIKSRADLLGTEAALQSAISLLSNSKTRLDLLGTEVAAQSAISLLSNLKTRADLLGTEVAAQSSISILSNLKTRADLLGTEAALQSAISLLSNLKIRADLLGTQATFSNVLISIDNLETTVTASASRTVGVDENAGVSITIAAAAYAAGDCVGGAVTINNLARGANLGGILKGMKAVLNRAITPAVDVYIRAGAFDKAPADNASMSAAAAASFSSTDWPLLRGPVRVAAADWRPAGAAEHAYVEQAMGLPPSDSGTAYQVVAKFVDAVASAAASTLRVDFDLMQN